jgi:hypothetical protein
MGLLGLVSGSVYTVASPCSESPVLPAVSQCSLALDLSALPTDIRTYPANVTYRGLAEAAVPCLAARASTLGNLLDQKAQALSQRKHICLLRGEKAGEQSIIVLYHAADEARNRAAGDAMEAFYHLIEAQGRLAYLLLGLKEVNESLKRAEELQAKGLHPPVEISVIRKQLTDLRSDEVNLRIAILQLNARLKVLLGLSSGDYFLCPLANLKVVPGAPAIDEAVDYGLSHRPDLAFLESLLGILDCGSVGLAAQALGGVNPLLGEPSSSVRCAALLACLDSSKAESVKQQVETLLAERRRQATEEIRQAVMLVIYRSQLVILARQKVENEERRIKELDERKAKGLEAEGELSTARLNLYKAQGELLREVVNWRIARAQLLQAQGRLLEEYPCTNTVTAAGPGLQPTEGPSTDPLAPGAASWAATWLGFPAAQGRNHIAPGASPTESAP